MAHIDLPEGLPGIIGPMAAYPASRKPLNDLANAVMCGPSSLTKAERELIATFVSSRNECRFCTNSHAAAARHLFGSERNIVDEVISNRESASISPKVRALLDIADKVRQDGRLVTTQDIERARSEGADDQAIHDTVLITGMFSMFNRYVDGLGTFAPSDATVYEEIGERIGTKGYGSRPYPDEVK